MAEWTSWASALGAGVVLGWVALPLLLRLAARARRSAPAAYYHALVSALLLAVALVLVPLARELGAGLRSGLVSWWPESSPAALPVQVTFGWAEPLLVGARAAWPAQLLDAALLLIAGAWGLALAAGLVGMLRAQLELSRRCRRTTAAPAAVHARAQAIARELGIRVPAIQVSTVSELPFSAGVYRPRVILPQSLVAQASEEEIGFTLRHELTHVARGDLVGALGVGIARRFFAGHPTAKRFGSEIALAREAAVDASVAGDDPVPYAQFLLELARRVHLDGRDFPAHLSMADSALTRRIDMLLSSNASSKNPARARPAWIPLLTLGVGATLLAPVSCGSSSSPARAPNRDSAYTFAPDPTQQASPRGDETASAVDAQREPVDAYGRLAPEVIRKTVREHYPAFRRCYETLPPPLSPAEVEMRFTIGRDGKVKEGGIEARERESLGSCVEAAMFAMVFPEPLGGNVTVVYPLQFAPGTD
jgi:beta-lactamase regulating signal transducer with metallopeptidase domain